MDNNPTGRQVDLWKLAALGWSLIPCGPDKKPLIDRWKPYQENAAPIEQLREWEGTLRPSAWAMVTGKVSGVITLDFDGKQGQGTLDELGLNPHRQSGRGGRHVDLTHPGWHVPTLNYKTNRSLAARWPGLDVRGDGGYIVCVGRNLTGPYLWLRDPVPDSFHLVPAGLQEFLRPSYHPAPAGQQGGEKTSSDAGRVTTRVLIDRALEQIPAMGRNNSGFWLATQLRDHGYLEREAEPIMLEYVARVPPINLHGEPEPYTPKDAQASLRQAYSRSRREPWPTSRKQAARPCAAAWGTSSEPNKAPGFFQRNAEPRGEVVEGLIREGQIVTLGGPYGVGKSPLLQELTICRLRGAPWCGRKVKPGPVITFDFESSSPTYKNNLIRIARRYKAQEPEVPTELEPYLQNDDLQEPLTARLLQALKSGINERLQLLREALKGKPDALVIVDPTELLFWLDTTKKQPVNLLFAQYRLLLADYPKAVLLGTFNMRKLDRKSPKRPHLLHDPRGWLEEVCGTLDLMNRSDVRLGMDFYGCGDDDMRVLHGVRRGEDMNPILIVPFGDPPDDLAGFERVPSEQISLTMWLSSKQQEHWQELPNEFTWGDAAKLVSKSSLSRLIARARSLGILEAIAVGVYRKLVTIKDAETVEPKR